MKRWLTYVLSAIILASCVKETDWNPEQEADPLIVVDGIITDVQGEQVIRLSWSVNDLNENPAPVSGATLLISDEDSTWQLSEDPADSGNYVTPAAFVAIPGKNFSLIIHYGGKIYSAKSAMKAGILFEPLVYKKNDGDSLFHIDWIASVFTTENPAMWEVRLDWSRVPGYEGTDPDSTSARLLFYSLPTLDVGQIFAPAVEQIRFPAGTVIDEFRYSLTDEHAEFIRELLMETNWQGGLFSSCPAGVPTNLSRGATGWFGACGQTSLSLIVNP